MRVRQTFLTSLFVLFGTSFSLHAAGTNGKGLITSTQAEHDRIHYRKVAQVMPNKIGASRIQIHHDRIGEAPPTLTVATTSAEEFLTQPSAQTQTVVLPTSVNNSLLPSFPPIGNQQQLSSSVAWGTTYYLATHETGLLNGVNNKTSFNRVLSPKWTYNILNGGQDGGLSITAPFILLEQNGACSIAAFPYDTDFTAWDLKTQDWISAISYRMQPYVALDGLNTSPQNLTKIKQALVNGHVLTMATYIDSWVTTNITSNPNTQNHALGQLACSWMNGSEGGHCMTVVGYDDEIWIDVNGNGQVDPGELGAFLIANSWGTDWGNQGFVWVSYDAFLSTSAVPNGPSSGRVPLGDPSNSILLSAVPKAAQYTPSLVAEFNLSQTQRDQIKIACGTSSTAQEFPSHYFFTSALSYTGGPLEFDGISSTTPQTGTFPLDLTDLASTSNQNYYLIVCDNAAGNPTTVNGLSLVNLSNGQSVQVITSPFQVDNSKVTKAVEYTYVPPAVTSPLSMKITSISNVQSPAGVMTLSVQPSRSVVRMEFYIDGVLQSTDSAAPYLTHVDTTKMTKGVHKLSFVAYDQFGQTTSAITNIRVKN